MVSQNCIIHSSGQTKNDKTLHNLFQLKSDKDAGKDMLCLWHAATF